MASSSSDASASTSSDASADLNYVCMHLRHIGRPSNRPGNANLMWYVLSSFLQEDSYGEF